MLPGLNLIPTEPQDKSARRANDQIVRLHRLTAVASEDASQSGSQRDRACKRDCAANRMHHGGARKIVEGDRRHIGEPTSRSPRPMPDDRIDEAGDANAVKQGADKITPSNHSARGDRRARIRKRILEHPVRQDRGSSGAIRRRQAMQHETGRADP